MKKFALLCLVLLAGCSKKPETTPYSTEPVLTQQFRQESVTVLFTVSETNISTSGKIQLMLDVHTPQNMAVTLPSLKDETEPFSIGNSYTEPLQTLPNGKLLHRQVWELLPPVPGDYSLQPIEVTANGFSLHTKAVSVHVASILPEGADAFEIKDIAPAIVLMPEQQKMQHRFIAAAIAALFITAIALSVKQRKRKAEPVEPPYITALRELDQLPVELIPRLDGLDLILRNFIAAKFALPAQVKTTAELFPLLPKEILLGRREKLEAFLTQSEQARFSNKITAEFTEAFELYIREFIDAMKEEEPCA